MGLTAEVTDVNRWRQYQLIISKTVSLQHRRSDQSTSAWHRSLRRDQDDVPFPVVEQDRAVIGGADRTHNLDAAIAHRRADVFDPRIGGFTSIGQVRQACLADSAWPICRLI